MMLRSQSGYMSRRVTIWSYAPKGVRRIGQLALRDIYQGLLKDRAGSHTTDHRGITEMRPDQTRPYEFGDPLNLNSSRRSARPRARSRGAARAKPDDFEIYENDYGQLVVHRPMPRYVVVDELGGRFAAARKSHWRSKTLIRSKFPRDYFSIVDSSRVRSES